jgi:tyrosine-specific transport protein
MLGDVPVSILRSSCRHISASGNLFSTFFQGLFGPDLPNWIGSLFFVVLFGGVVLYGTRGVDLWNRVLMLGKILFFVALLLISFQYIKPQLLLRTDSSKALFSLPILITSFGFHNMIPTLTAYMQRDLKRVRITIIAGGLFAFAVYLIWEVIVLGIVPISGLGHFRVLHHG